jgi:hypothetical protein
MIDQETFRRRCLELYTMFGYNVTDYDLLPDSFREFVTLIGYERVCSLMITYDLSRGKTERQLSIKYSVTRHCIRAIKAANRVKRPYKLGGIAPSKPFQGV